MFVADHRLEEYHHLARVRAVIHGARHGQLIARERRKNAHWHAARTEHARTESGAHLHGQITTSQTYLAPLVTVHFQANRSFLSYYALAPSLNPSF